MAKVHFFTNAECTRVNGTGCQKFFGDTMTLDGITGKIVCGVALNFDGKEHEARYYLFDTEGNHKLSSYFLEDLKYQIIRTIDGKIDQSGFTGWDSNDNLENLFAEIRSEWDDTEADYYWYAEVVPTVDYNNAHNESHRRYSYASNRKGMKISEGLSHKSLIEETFRTLKSNNPNHRRPRVYEGYEDYSKIFEFDEKNGTITRLKDKTVIDLVIPSEINGVRVRGIDENAFEDCTSLTSVTIPDSVTIISWGAFLGCTSLKNVVMPDNIREIEAYAFKNCKSLQNITLPNIASIENGTFSSCYSLQNIIIPSSVTEIGNGAFYDCVSLTSITIPDSVTWINHHAFYECTSLKSITIPNSVTEIGNRAFEACTSLESIVIPDSVKTIGNWAFQNCLSLKDVKLPENIEMGEDVFKGTPVEYLDDKHNESYYRKPIYRHKKVYEDYEDYSKIFEFDENHGMIIGLIIGLGDKPITDLIIPPEINGVRVKEIGDAAFRYCGLKSVTIPDSVTRIGIAAFAFCTSLKSVTIGSGVTEISFYAFALCTSLKSVTIPDSVKYIDDSAFVGCKSLKDIKLPEDVKLGQNVFKGTPVEYLDDKHTESYQ